MPILATAKQSFEPIPEEIYEFFVEEAKRSYSTNKNLMFRLRLTTEYKGVDRGVYDHIVFIDKCAFKITNYLRALGYAVKEGDPLDEELIESSRGKKVKAKVIIEEDPKYGPQNRIAYYIEPDEGANKVPSNAKEDPDDIPF